MPDSTLPKCKASTVAVKMGKSQIIALKINKPLGKAAWKSRL